MTTAKSEIPRVVSKYTAALARKANANIRDTQMPKIRSQKAIAGRRTVLIERTDREAA